MCECTCFTCLIIWHICTNFPFISFTHALGRIVLFFCLSSSGIQLSLSSDHCLQHYSWHLFLLFQSNLKFCRYWKHRLTAHTCLLLPNSTRRVLVIPLHQLLGMNGNDLNVFFVTFCFVILLNKWDWKSLISVKIFNSHGLFLLLFCF